MHSNSQDSSTTLTYSHKPILSTPEDWPTWLYLLVSLAKKGTDILEFINPDLSTQPALPPESIRPVIPAKPATATDIQLYQFSLDEYKE